MKKYMALAALLSVAACGGSATSTTAQAQASPNAGAGQQRQGFPGTAGLLAALSGNTLQVQSSSAQTAVTYGSATTFTDTVKATAADVTVGSCVVVRSGDTSTGGPTPRSVTATSVSLSAPVDGTCTGGFGGAGRASGPGGSRPSGAPNITAPSGPRAGGTQASDPPRNGRGLGGTFGKVVSRSAGGFVVASTRPGASTSATQKVTVTTTGSTAYTMSKKATATALKVGECVTARGKADTTGTVAATAISIRPATNGACPNAGGPGA